MPFSSDKTGFPLVPVLSAGVEVQLLPVCKVQFERYLAETRAHGDAWYDSLLALNPRTSYRRFTTEERERIFLTGLLPEEVEGFAQWLGDGYRVPTISEWRLVYSALGREQAGPALAEFTARNGNHPAGVLLARLAQLTGARTLLDLSLMNGGVVEWVRKEFDWVGVGAPRPNFMPNLWNPLNDELKPLRNGTRLPYFGCRLVRGR